MAVWPENWPLFMLFRRLQTQWRIGMAGATGLDYAALYPLLDRQYPRAADWLQAFDDIGQMELAALAAMRGESLPEPDGEINDDDADPPDSDDPSDL